MTKRREFHPLRGGLGVGVVSEESLVHPARGGTSQGFILASPQSTSGFPLGLMAMIVALVALGVFLKGRPQDQPHIPEPLPPLLVEGWLNVAGDTPAREDFAGKVVAVDVWALFCGPCKEAMPEMVKLHERFGDREDFVLIGLTPDPDQTPGDDLPAVQEYVQSVEGLDWPIGYGARATLGAMNVRYFPTLVLYGRDGLSVYRGWSVAALEKAAENELGKQ